MGERIKFESQITKVEKINPFCSRVLIRIAYEGINRNNSYISRSAFDAAEYSLPRIMILGEYSESIEDFRGHGGKIEIIDDNVKYINTTIPYGFVDVDTEISWQDVVEEDGTTRQYICATGYVWTGRYPELEDLISNSKSQSMEIDVLKSQDKIINGIKCVEITEFVFYALTILGDDIEPCFESSTISAYTLDQEKFKLDFARMVAELKFSLTETYNIVETVIVNNPIEMWKCPHCKDFIGEKELYFNNDKWYHSPCIEKGEIQFNKKSLQSDVVLAAKEPKEGGNKIVPENILALLAKYSLTENDLIEKEITYTEFSIEELEVKINETFQKEKFSLTSEQLEDELRRELAEIEVITEDWWGEVYKYPRYSYVDNKLDANIVVACDCKNRYLVGFTFAQINDNVEVDEASLVRYKIDYNPMVLSGDPDPEEFTGDDDFDMVPTDVVDYQLKRKEAEMKNDFSSEKSALIAKIDEKEDALLQLNEKFAAINAQLVEKDEKIQSLEQYSKEIEEAKNKEKVDALFAKYSIYFKPEEIEELREKQTTFEKFELFEKEVKSIACDRLVEATKENKPLHAFVEIPKTETEVDAEDTNDVFVRLKSKLN